MSDGDAEAPAGDRPRARGRFLAAERYAQSAASGGAGRMCMLSPKVWAASAIVIAMGCTATTYTVPYDPGPERPKDPASQGAEAYAEHCASCHGENGEGTEGRPKLVGKDAIPPDPTGARKVPIRTAQDLFAFSKSDMPPIAPGSLDDDQYWAIVTYLAKANGADLHGQAVTSKNAAGVMIHP